MMLLNIIILIVTFLSKDVSSFAGPILRHDHQFTTSFNKLVGKNGAELNLYSSIFTSPSNANTKQESYTVNNRHSAKDWLYNFRSLPRSSVLREIKGPIISVTAWSTIISVLRTLLLKSSNHTCRAVAKNMCISTSAHSFLVSALGLLLVFRTNSAYQRFNEGRKIWENILSISRNLSRMIQLYAKEIGAERKNKIISFLAAYPYLLRHHIRTGCLCEEEAAILVDDKNGLLLHEPSITMVETRYEGDKTSGGSTHVPEKQIHATSLECWVDRRKLPWKLLDRESQETVARAQNRPLWVCDRIGREIMNIPYGPNFTSRERLSLFSKLEKLTDTIGQCERIHQTAVPLNYARHSLRSLTMWLFTLPFALVKDIGIFTGPATGIIAWLLFGVYQIGYSIEDPFQGSLRLSILCDAIRRDVVIEDDEFKYKPYENESVLNYDAISDSNYRMNNNRVSRNENFEYQLVTSSSDVNKQICQLKSIDEVNLKKLLEDQQQDILSNDTRKSCEFQ